MCYKSGYYLSPEELENALKLVDIGKKKESLPRKEENNPTIKKKWAKKFQRGEMGAKKIFLLTKREHR